MNIDCIFDIIRIVILIALGVSLWFLYRELVRAYKASSYDDCYEYRKDLFLVEEDRLCGGDNKLREKCKYCPYYVWRYHS